jgi:hypothetical protein
MFFVTWCFHLAGKYLPTIFTGETLSVLLGLALAMWGGAVYLYHEMDKLEELEGLNAREQLRARILMGTLRPAVIKMGLTVIVFGALFYIVYSDAFKLLVGEKLSAYLPALSGFVYSVLICLSVKMLIWVLQVRDFARVVKQRNIDKSNHQKSIQKFA